MKKAIVIAGLVMAVLLAGCATKQGAANGGVTPENPIEESYQNVYNRYKGDLILDGATTYTVKKGDALNEISRVQYKNGFYYPVIMLASSDVVLDPYQIEDGMQLTIPDLQKNLNDAKARSRIKSFLVEIANIEEGRNWHATAVEMRKLADTL